MRTATGRLGAASPFAAALVVALVASALAHPAGPAAARPPSEIASGAGPRESGSGGGGRPAVQDEMSAAERRAIADRIERNVKRLRSTGHLPEAGSLTQVSLGWPLRLRAGIA